MQHRNVNMSPTRGFFRQLLLALLLATELVIVVMLAKIKLVRRAATAVVV